MSVPPSDTTPTYGQRVGAFVDQAEKKAKDAQMKIEEAGSSVAEEVNKAMTPPEPVPTLGERVGEYIDVTGKKLEEFTEGVSNTFYPAPKEPTLGDKVADFVDGYSTVFKVGVVAVLLLLCVLMILYATSLWVLLANNNLLRPS